MSRTIPPHIRQARIRLGRFRVRQALAAFHAGDRPQARWAYLDAAGWFDRAGLRSLATRASRLGERVIEFQKAGGEHVGPARRLAPIGTSSRGRIVSFKGVAR